jgi:hypothetical protein
MKTLGRFLTALSLTVLLFAASAHAQFNDKKITVNVPFAFTVGNTDLPPGHYVFVRTGANSLQLRTDRGFDILTVLTGYASEVGAPPQAKLRFKTEGERKILFQVWQGDSYGMELHLPHRAIELAKQATSKPSGNGRH